MIGTTFRQFLLRQHLSSESACQRAITSYLLIVEFTLSLEAEEMILSLPSEKVKLKKNLLNSI